MSDKNGEGGFLLNYFVLFTVWTLVSSSWTGIAAHKFCYLSGFFFLLSSLQQ
jgi:hypothetical protein